MSRLINHCIFLLCATYGAMVWALDVHEFDSPSQRQRYQQLTYELRCPKCQNQNLADSNSQISIDLRAEVVRLLKEGKTDTEIKQYMVDRYGDFVLYRPPMQGNTFVLWWGPVLILGIGVIAFFAILVKRSRVNVVVEGEPELEADDTDEVNQNRP
ncbi:Cytochrome c-type biogenesis protein CcmH [Thalassocella blandensis]|nr:Cytochrome c-type biogenesis protein CcmH [Thalassocella blandensis]